MSRREFEIVSAHLVIDGDSISFDPDAAWDVCDALDLVDRGDGENMLWCAVDIVRSGNYPAGSCRAQVAA